MTRYHLHLDGLDDVMEITIDDPDGTGLQTGEKVSLRMKGLGVQIDALITSISGGDVYAAPISKKTLH